MQRPFLLLSSHSCLVGELIEVLMDRLGLKAGDEVVRLLTGLLMVSLWVVTVLFKGEVIGVGNKGGS